MKLSFKQKFNTRQEISVLLGGDTQKGSQYLLKQILFFYL